MKKCEKCGGKTFTTYATTEIDLNLVGDGVLEAVTEIDQGIDGVITCNSCNKEYSQADFEAII